MTTTADDITPAELDAMQARCEDATPGPWHEDDGHIHSTPQSEAVDAYINRLMNDPAFRSAETDDQTNRPWTEVAHVSQDSPNFDADTEFLKHARTDLPRLLSALRKANAETKTVMQAWDTNVKLAQDLLFEARAEVETLTEQRDAAITGHGVYQRAAQKAREERRVAESEHDAAKALLARAAQALRYMAETRTVWDGITPLLAEIEAEHGK